MLCKAITENFVSLEGLNDFLKELERRPSYPQELHGHGSAPSECAKMLKKPSHQEGIFVLDGLNATLEKNLLDFKATLHLLIFVCEGADTETLRKFTDTLILAANMYVAKYSNHRVAVATVRSEDGPIASHFFEVFELHQEHGLINMRAAVPKGTLFKYDPNLNVAELTSLAPSVILNWIESILVSKDAKPFLTSADRHLLMKLMAIEGKTIRKDEF